MLRPAIRVCVCVRARACVSQNYTHTHRHTHNAHTLSPLVHTNMHACMHACIHTYIHTHTDKQIQTDTDSICVCQYLSCMPMCMPPLEGDKGALNTKCPLYQPTYFCMPINIRPGSQREHHLHSCHEHARTHTRICKCVYIPALKSVNSSLVLTTVSLHQRSHIVAVQGHIEGHTCTRTHKDTYKDT